MKARLAAIAASLILAAGALAGCSSPAPTASTAWGTPVTQSEAAYINIPPWRCVRYYDVGGWYTYCNQKRTNEVKWFTPWSGAYVI